MARDWACLDLNQGPLPYQASSGSAGTSVGTGRRVGALSVTHRRTTPGTAASGTQRARLFVPNPAAHQVAVRSRFMRLRIRLWRISNWLPVSATVLATPNSGHRWVDSSTGWVILGVRL